MKLKKLTRKKTTALLLLIVLILLTVVLGIFLYSKYSGNELGSLVASEQKSIDDKDELITKVGKLIKLPNETPDVATVTDVELLQNQSIFRNAQNGDKVLIYTQAKRAIVYRPSENIIVEVGNIMVNSEGSASVSASVSPKAARVASVAVYNATSTSGYAGRIGDELESKFSNVQVIDTANAAGDYDAVLVVDLTGGNDEVVSTLAEELGGEVGDFPEGEEKPETDILIILGQ